MAELLGSLISVSSTQMALTIASGGGGGRVLCRSSSGSEAQISHLPFRRHLLFPLSDGARTLHVAFAKKLSSRTGRFDSKNRRSSTKIKEQEDEEEELQRTVEIGPDDASKVENVGVAFDDENLPELPGQSPDFWEGSQWDALGFFVQYLWAFGIVFALISSGIAVATYNEGATDFKDTPVYKESVQSRELLEEPGVTSPDVFESNPTEVAPSLE